MHNKYIDYPFSAVYPNSNKLLGKWTDDRTLLKKTPQVFVFSVDHIVLKTIRMLGWERREIMNYKLMQTIKP